MVENAVKHARVLAIDDSPEFLASLSCFFESAHDFELVATGCNGQQALTLVQDLHPDLVLMDLQMAGMNGLEATMEIHSRFPEIEVVIVTAHDIPGLRQVCFDYGASNFVAKSRLNQELPRVLGRFLNAREA